MRRRVREEPIAERSEPSWPKLRRPAREAVRSCVAAQCAAGCAKNRLPSAASRAGRSLRRPARELEPAGLDDATKEALQAGESPGSLKICSGGPSSHTTPSARKQTRLATSRAKPISWVASTIVSPSSLRSRTMFEHLGDELGVEGAGDLVEQQHPRLHRERPHDRDPLLLAAREPVGILVRLLGEADALEERASRPPPRSSCGCPRTRIGASVMFFSTVMCGKRLKLWNTMPTSRRTSSTSTPMSVMQSPLIVIDPPSTVSSRLMQRSSVDLPGPDAPMRHTTSCSLTDMSMPRSTQLSPKRFSTLVDLEVRAHAFARIFCWSRLTRWSTTTASGIVMTM